MKIDFLIYKFHKNGHVYTATGANRFEVQTAVELAHHVDLTGATFEEVRKGAVIRTGIVK